MTEADFLVDAELASRVLDVFEDGGAVGDGLGALPRSERVAERVHVRVGADAGIAEEIPRAADGVAAFEDGVGAAGAASLKVIARRDAGEPGADHEHIEVDFDHEPILS